MSPERVSLAGLFPAPLPVVGVVHLLPLPGSPGWGGSMEAVLERAVADGRALEEGGVDGLLVENFGDVPFLPGPLPPPTVAGLTAAVRAVRAASSLPVGVNALRNDASAALGAAVAAGARFIRVNVHTGTMFGDQGVLEGRAHETLRLRRILDARVAILADVFVKHAIPPSGATLEDGARNAWERGRADGLVVTGRATGRAPDPHRISTVRHAVPDAPVWVGSGVTPATAADLLGGADGAIVGSALEERGRAGSPVEGARVRALMDSVRALRGGS